MTQYRFVSATIFSDTDIGELAMSDVQFEYALNTTGSFSGRVHIPSGSDIASIRDMTNPRNRVLYIYRDGIPIYGGIIWTRRYLRRNKIFEISGMDWMSYFEKRLYRHIGGNVEWIFPPKDLTKYMNILIWLAQAEEARPQFGGLGIKLKVYRNEAIQGESRVTLQKHNPVTFASLFSTACRGIAEWRSYVTVEDGRRKRQILLGIPRLGTYYDPANSIYPQIVFERSLTEDVSYNEEGLQGANRIIAQGPTNIEGGTLETEVVDAEDLHTYPLSDVFTKYDGASNLDELNKWAKQDLTTYWSGTFTQPDIEAVAGWSPEITNINVGDWAKFIFRDEPLQLEHKGRIQRLSFYLPDNSSERMRITGTAVSGRLAPPTYPVPPRPPTPGMPPPGTPPPGVPPPSAPDPEPRIPPVEPPPGSDLTPTSGYIRVGSYVGTGIDVSQKIAIPSPPTNGQLVFLFIQILHSWTSDMSTNDSYLWIRGLPPNTGNFSFQRALNVDNSGTVSSLSILFDTPRGLADMGPDSFTIREGTGGNYEGATYGYLALYANMDVLVTGSYTGNGGDHHYITMPVSWSPELIIIIPHDPYSVPVNAGVIALNTYSQSDIDNGTGPSSTGWRSSLLTGLHLDTTALRKVGPATNFPDPDLAVGQFEVNSGGDVNASDQVYSYLAVRSAADHIISGQYAIDVTGDQVAKHRIAANTLHPDITTGKTFSPQWMIVHPMDSNSSQMVLTKHYMHPTGVCQRIAETNQFLTNAIDRMEYGSFYTGTDSSICSLGQAYNWMLFKP